MGSAVKFARHSSALLLVFLVIAAVLESVRVAAAPMSNAEAQRIIGDSRRSVVQRTERAAQSPATTSTNATPPNTTSKSTSKASVRDLHEILKKLNTEIDKLTEQKRVMEVATKDENRNAQQPQMRATLEVLRAMMSDESRQRFLQGINEQIASLTIERTAVVSSISKIIQADPNGRSNSSESISSSQEVSSEKKQHSSIEEDDASDDNASPGSQISQSNSRLICQFFVFGTIFGVVCTISACTWSFSKCDENGNSTNSNSNNVITRLTQTPEPFDSTKPYCIKVDDKGLCYASPLSGSEIPPLPEYSEALQMSRSITALFNQSPKEALPSEDSSAQSLPPSTAESDSSLKV